MVVAYVIHVLDECLLGGSFVEKVRQHWWPEYSWTKFFWFNAGYFTIMIASVVAYDFLGGWWLIFPLACASATDSGISGGLFTFANILPACFPAS